MRLDEPFNKTAYVLAGIIKWLGLLPRSLSLRCVELGSGIPGKRFVYLGEGESLPYIRHILAQPAGEFRVPQAPLRHLGKMIRRLASPDTLLCLELNRLLHSLAPGGGFITFPWIRQRVILDSLEYRARRRRIEKVGRMVRKYKYRFQLVNHTESVAHFYEEFYVPYIRARFGDAAHMRSLNELQRWVGSGFLLQVLHEDSWISGVVCGVRKDELSVLASGHIPEDKYPLRLGALSAAYYYLFEYARRHSLTVVDLLRSRPHADDGVYQYKQRWGATPEVDSWPHTTLHLFLPEGFPVPAALAKLLIWDGLEFVEMGELLQRKRIPRSQIPPAKPEA
jgi:hypothetical protein